MNIKRTHALAATGALLALALAGCSNSDSGSAASEDGGDKPKIAGVFENTQDPFWASYVCGVKDKARELGLSLKATEQPTQDTQKLGSALDAALLAEPDGLLFNPIDPAPWNTKLGSLMSSGIPVVTVQNFDAIKNQLSYSQADDSGKPFVGQVTELAHGQSGKAVRLLGLASAPWQDNRLDPITAALKTANPGLTWLPDQVDGFDVNKGTQIISSLITANPDLKLILSPAGPEGQAIAAAIAQTGAKGVTVISFDAVPAEVDALRRGTIQMLIAQPARELGAGELQTLYDYLTSGTHQKGKPVAAGAAKPFIRPVGVLTKDNVDAPENKKFIYSGTC